MEGTMSWYVFCAQLYRDDGIQRINAWMPAKAYYAAWVATEGFRVKLDDAGLGVHEANEVAGAP